MKRLLVMLLGLSSSLAQAQIHPGGGAAYMNPAMVGEATLGSSGTPAGGTGAIISPTTTPVTAAQWHFAGAGTIGTNPQDWLYSVVSTARKEYVGCGYTTAIAGGGRDGTIVKLDHTGNLSWSVPVNNVTIVDFDFWTFASRTTFTPATTTADVSGINGSSSLWKVAKAKDGYVAIGGNSEARYGYREFAFRILS